MTVITCHKLTKTYGHVKALDELTMEINENEITGLIGRNGAGKTTLLKLIAGYSRKTAGEIYVFSEDPFNNLFVSANMIFIDDQMDFPDTLTLGEILKEGERFYAKWDSEFAERLFKYFSFTEASFHATLSKGRKSTFNVIVGLAARCALTIFDEPTTGMDVATRKDFYRALLKDYLDYPRTIIISSHHLEEIEDVLENILLIDKGRKCLHLPIDTLREYAIGLTGQTEIIEYLTANKEVFYTRRMDEHNSYVVVKNDFSLDPFKKNGISITSVSPTDLCVHITNNRKRGIDDVFINR